MLSDRDYRTIFDASPDATLVVDADGVVRDLNSQALVMFGWTRQEIEGAPVERLIPEGSRAQHVRERQEYANRPRPRPMGQGLELLALRKNGNTFPVEISLSPGRLEHAGGHVICTIRDISVWKRQRRLSEMMVTAAENERRHLSHELHDELLQALVALKIRVKLLADETDYAKRERLRVVLADHIHDTIRGVKRLIRGLLPPDLEDRPLSLALESVFRDLREVFGFTIQARLEPLDDRLDVFVAMALYRVIQEAVTNAMRHSGVNCATVTATLESDRIVAEIRDEGCGFERPQPGAMPAAGHLGLAGMHERAELVGGRVTVETAPGVGTTIRAIVPASEKNPAREALS